MWFERELGPWVSGILVGLGLVSEIDSNASPLAGANVSALVCHWDPESWYLMGPVLAVEIPNASSSSQQAWPGPFLK